ncbi:hypothetical protein DV515_00014706 [Chloebia gouldiae]|uniref:Uncharacterized protein n=1 Tax=Chloebia gouldiae TaxID=44316 RepID=A0A3L8RYY9_CHLGU|nr:hypothetical protein DV515_00014706 [Chloebia gouldiae]
MRRSIRRCPSQICSWSLPAGAVCKEDTQLCAQVSSNGSLHTGTGMPAILSTTHIPKNPRCINTDRMRNPSERKSPQNKSHGVWIAHGLSKKQTLLDRNMQVPDGFQLLVSAQKDTGGKELRCVYGLNERTPDILVLRGIQGMSVGKDASVKATK